MTKIGFLVTIKKVQGVARKQLRKIAFEIWQAKRQMLEQLMGLLPQALPEIRQVNRSRILTGGSHHQHFYFEVTHQSGAPLALVARVPFADDESTRRRMLMEHMLLRFLHEQGYDWMPNSLYHGFTSSKPSTSSIQSVPFSLQTYIAGTRPRRLSRKQAAELAGLVAALHSLRVSPALAATLPVYQTWQDYAQAWLVAMRLWFEMLAALPPPEALVGLLAPVYRSVQKVGAVVQERPAFMQAATGRQYIVHGDIGRHNLLQAGEAEVSGDRGEHGERKRLYLLDWEFAGSGDPAFDIAVTFQSPRLQKSWHAAFTETYSALVSGGWLENFWQRVAFYAPVVYGHTALWALGELFKSWPAAQSLSQVAWYASTLRNRLALIDLETGEQAAALLDRLLGERFPGGSE